jgi:crotonobetainyl-CoA:carnitine CoA-transferase CaiB-like acyl-CoA transferase
MLLGDLGAEIIKIERPDEGDYARWGEPKIGDTGQSALFHAVNRNKQSVVIDLKKDEGREAFLELAKEADVIYEQFSPGTVERLGISYDDVREVNSEIIYCSLSGYGQNGPYAERAGHDINYQGLAGVLDLMRSRGSNRPATPGFPVADMVGGMTSAFAIVSALLNRELGHGGDYLDVSMTDAVISLGTGHAWRALLSDQLPDDQRTISSEYPCYGIYETADGEYVTVAALEEKL